MFNRRRSPANEMNPMVDKWRFAAFADSSKSSVAFKGCVISPDGSLVAYWTDSMIRLCTSHSISDRSSEDNEGLEYHLEDNDCFFKTVGLTDQYLVASTTLRNFDCYIFDLKRGTSPDASLRYPYRVSLAPPGIEKVAISPDSEGLACTLRHEEDEGRPGWLFYAKLPEMVKAAKRLYVRGRCSSSRILTSSIQQSETSEHLRNKCGNCTESK